VSEELAFEQVLRQGRAVDLDKRTTRAAAGLVHRAGHQLLARAAFALYQDRRLAAGHIRHQVEQFAHLGIPAHEAAEPVTGTQLLAQGGHLGHVTQYQRNAQRRSIPIQQRSGPQQDMAPLAIRQLNRGLEIDDGLSRDQRLLQHVLGAGLVPEQFADQNAGQLLAASTQDFLRRGVHGQDVEVGIQGEDPLPQGIYDRQHARRVDLGQEAGDGQARPVALHILVHWLPFKTMLQATYMLQQYRCKPHPAQAWPDVPPVPVQVFFPFNPLL